MSTPNPLTTINDRLTPSRPIQITFAAETGLPSALQEVLLIGHQAATGASTAYSVVEIANAGDLIAASGEVAAKFGDGSELALMVLAAIRTNQDTGNYVSLKCVPLASTDTDFGASDIALTNASKVKAEFLVSCYDDQNTANRTKLRDTAIIMSGPDRTDNNQFGTVGVVFNRSVTDPTTFDTVDSQFIARHWLRDTGSGAQAPVYSVAEMAAACAAKEAGNPVPFNPLDRATVFEVAAPAKQSDWITVGANLESEAALVKGVTPLRVNPDGTVAFVRTRTARLTTNGVTPVSSYFDLQDFQVLYYLRKAIWTRVNQPDFATRKASASAAQDIKSECIRIMQAFQAQTMLQAVDQLAKQVVVQRSTTDRSRFDVFIPVNVIPGLHVIATNIQAGTQFDQLTV
jgi:phage tail sheath gpL-like